MLGRVGGLANDPLPLDRIVTWTCSVYFSAFLKTGIILIEKNARALFSLLEYRNDVLLPMFTLLRHPTGRTRFSMRLYLVLFSNN